MRRARLWSLCIAASIVAAVGNVPANAQIVSSAPAFSAQSARAIDAVARDEVRSGTSPGVAIGVVQDGLLVYARAFGYANLQRHRQASAGTEFYVGEITEQFTAASVLLLAQTKALSLSDKVTRYVPELTVARDV